MIACFASILLTACPGVPVYARFFSRELLVHGESEAGCYFVKWFLNSVDAFSLQQSGDGSYVLHIRTECYVFSFPTVFIVFSAESCLGCCIDVLESVAIGSENGFYML